jgi:hypothetical protein
MEIVAPISDWERWTGTSFPVDGRYLFPRCLAPLTVANHVGDYWEPNLWMVHEV